MGEKRSGLWVRGNESFSSVNNVNVENMTSEVSKTHSTKGQNKDNGDKTMLNFVVDFSNVPIKTIYEGFVEFWTINWFRKNPPIGAMSIEEATEKYEGKTLNAMDFQPVEGERKSNPDDRAISALVKAGFSREDAELVIRQKEKAVEQIHKLRKAA